MKKYVALIALVLAATGCVSVQPTQLDLQPVSNTSLVVADNRPLDQKETEMLSYIVTNCDYGIQRLGDEWTTPDKLAYLKAEVGRLYPNAKRLDVNNFVVYNNMQYQLREGNIYRGPVWALLECNEATDRFTLYTPEENPQRYDMLIGTFEGTIDGKAYTARAAEFPVCPDGMAECDGLAARGNAIKKILQNIVAQIEQSGPPIQ